MSAFYATNKEVKILSDKLDLLNAKLDSVSDSGLHANRPDATTVRPGFIYYSVDLPENKLSYSDGTNWVVIS